MIDLRSEDGGATIAVGGTAAVIGLVLLVIVLDITAYLAAASAAQAAADGAALAAVAVSDPRGRQPGSPRAAAELVTTAADSRLETCRCRPGARRVEVEVSRRVDGVLITRYAARRVTARAAARLVPP
ncbi:MAG: hypothetical protein R3343_05570 [Nitriliruptorales bacterium]|nr:hypothetical protein [Nitriliruptorales bacterium]